MYVERLIYFITFFLIMNHLIACLYIYIAKIQLTEYDNLDNWIDRMGYVDASDSFIYISSFYWTLETITTVGYGDISAKTSIERVYTIFIMTFGVCMYSFAIGILSAIVGAMDTSTLEINEKLQLLLEIKNEYTISKSLFRNAKKCLLSDSTR